jgi:hypothetical protein
MNSTDLRQDSCQMPASDPSSRYYKFVGSHRFQLLLSFFTVIFIMAIMLWISWEKWGDTIIDTGRELYIPWQLSEGKVLYRDVFVNQYGPLSSYINAALFAIFGVRLMTLHIFNILLTMGVAAYIYRIFYKASGIFVATVNAAIFFSLFAFSDLTGLGIFNFVSPYAYAVTYSLALSLGVHYFLEKYGHSRSRLDIFIAGVLLGLAFLCKYEAFVAMSVCSVICLLFIYRPDKAHRRKIVGTWLAGISGFVIPSLGFLAYFSRFMPASQALSSMMLQYRQIFDMRVIDNNFYRTVSGTLDIKQSLVEIGWSLILYDFLALLGLLCAFLILKLPQKTLRIAATIIIVSGFLAAIVVYARSQPYFWMQISLRSLPLVLCVAVGVHAYGFYKNRHHDRLAENKSLIVFALFSLGFLAKIGLNVHTMQYGFILAMPATLIGSWLLIDAYPKYGETKLPGARWVLVSIGLVFLFGIVLSHFYLSSFSYAQKQLPVGEKNDRLITWHSGAMNGFECSFTTTYERGVRFKETLDELKKLLKPDDTLLVIPEGALFNYLTRHRNPTPYTSFILGDLVMFDESSMVSDLKQHSPDYIVIADRDLRIYGETFGKDVGQIIMAWVNRNYSTVKEIGPTPFKGLGFGTRILKRSLDKEDIGNDLSLKATIGIMVNEFGQMKA